MAVISDIAIEPDTWGIIGASGNNLIYWDRREPMPDNLSSTALTSSLIYGLDVQYDIFNPGEYNSPGYGTTHYGSPQLLGKVVILLPKDYGNSSSMIRWRYIVEDPLGNLSIINPDGSIINYTSNSGWQNNIIPPKPVKYTVTLIGTYTFTLQCFGQDGTISNANFPYPNLEVPSTYVINVSNITENPIQSVFYDWCKRLWIYDGVNLIPIKPIYDGYILDTAGKNIFFTRPYSSVYYT